MVRKYSRKTTRQSWDEQAMKSAVIAVTNDKRGLLEAAKQYNVPKSTLARRIKKYEQTLDPQFATRKGLGRFTQVFTVEQEEELVSYLREMEISLHGVSPYELRVLAYQLAEKNNIPHTFLGGVAGPDWLQGFLKRHPDLALRKPQATSAARARGFNKTVVNQFYDLLSETIERYDLTPDRIFNVDETGCTTVPKHNSKIIATKGRKQVGCLSSAERGKLVTVELCMSATGAYMPPMFIFPRKTPQAELLTGAPDQSWAQYNSSGWITGEIFCEWFRKFIIFSGATKTRPVLLLLDGHASHTKNINILDLARDNGVIILCFPPHCTHRLQPLDVTLMRPISIYYSAAVKKWLREHAGAVVTQCQIAELFGKAFMQAASLSNAVNGFKKTGIWPFNREVFSEQDFVAASTNSLPSLNAESEPAMKSTPVTENLRCESPEILSQVLSQMSIEESVCSDSIENPQPGCSRSFRPDSVDNQQPECSYSPLIDIGGKKIVDRLASSVSSLDSGSDSDAVMRRLGRVYTGPIAITDSEEEYGKKCSMAKKKTEKQKKKLVTPSSCSSKKRPFETSPSQLLPILKAKKSKRKITPRTGKTAVLTNSPYYRQLCQKRTPSSANTEDDTSCIFCEGLYSQSTESWIQCGSCQKWAHFSCANFDENAIDYLCDICIDKTTNKSKKTNKTNKK